MELIIIFSTIITLIYLFMIYQLITGFKKVISFEETNLTPVNSFTIIVPFRNECKNLNRLLNSFSSINYPHELLEIIMIDDHSKDNSSSIYIQWRIKNDTIDTTLLENLRLSNSPKKDAIARAMPIAKNPWIITTDADCIVNPDWLMTIDNFIQKNNPEMIASSVIYKTKNNWFHHFQQLDMMSLQATTIGSFGTGKPFMCNGANFAYTKKLFQELDGFNGNNNIASGDDVFLLQKATTQYPDKVLYLKSKSSIVKTKPENDLYKFIMQRVRWASKSTKYTSVYSKALAFVVLLMNITLVAGVVFMILGLIYWKIVVSLFLVKYFIDIILINKANTYLNNGKYIIPLASSIIYPFYVTIVGLYSIFGKFSWKGRSYSK